MPSLDLKEKEERDRERDREGFYKKIGKCDEEIEGFGERQKRKQETKGEKGLLRKYSYSIHAALQSFSDHCCPP